MSIRLDGMGNGNRQGVGGQDPDSLNADNRGRAQSSGVSTVEQGQDQNTDSDDTMQQSGQLTKESRTLALLSQATKMADAQTARNAKQADAMNQI